MIGPNGKNLIFLVSQPRAGSTLLQLMLAGHPDIATTSEPWIALHPLYALRDRGMHSEYDSNVARKALDEFLEQSGVGVAFYRKQAAAFMAALYSQAAASQKKTHFLDKTPRYYYIIPELMETFPEARFLILLRNPLAVLNSILRTWVKENTLLLGNYKNDLLKAPGMLVDALKKHPGRCLCVRYEEMVLSPEEVLQGICKYIGVDYLPELIEYGGEKARGWKLGDPVGVQKSSRPNVGSLDSWKKGFASGQNRLFAASYLEALGPALVKELGYDFGELAGGLEMAEEEKKGLVPWSDVMDRFTPYQTDRLLDHIDALKSSMSWKVTAPLRSAFDLARKIGPKKKT